MKGVSPPEMKSKHHMDDDDETTKPSSSTASHDVGATIARKRASQKNKSKGLLTSSSLVSPNPRKNKSRHSSTTTVKHHPHKTVPVKKRNGSSWDVFLEGTALYVLCLAAPTLLGLVVRWYEGWSKLQQLQVLAHRAAFGASPTSAWYHASTYFPMTWSYVCDSLSLTTHYEWCSSRNQTSLVEGAKKFRVAASLQAQDAHLSDLAIVIILSLSMALIRIWLVHLLVPRYLTSAQRLDALVRCKSIHLLSAAYPPSLTPNHSDMRPVMELTTTLDHHRPQALRQDLLPFLPDLQNSAGITNSEGEAFTFRSTEPDMHSTDHDSILPQPSSPLPPSLPSMTTLTTTDRIVHALSSIMHPILLSLNRSGSRALGHELATPNVYDSDDLKDRDRLFSAPRYATAVFRSLYCLASCSIALLFFQQANFWPTYLGGHGQTAKCWDLSGGTTLSFDSDFDHRNAVLRRYFLVQASYHLHSGAFHVLSMLLLWWWKLQRPVAATTHQPSSDSLSSLAVNPHVVISVRRSTKSYVRSLLQHMVALALIGGAYLFSSLRRLGAIAMFAFDLSSLSLHFLQICMNAPETSPLRNPDLILWVHRAWVIPMFLYTRFFVWPFLVWYSAVVESKQWLQQLESTLVPNSANYMRWVFHALLLYVISLNLVYFRRLLFHPHLKRILQEKRNKTLAPANEPASAGAAEEEDWEPLGANFLADPMKQAIFVNRRENAASTETSSFHQNSHRRRHDTTTLDTDENDSNFHISSGTGGDEEEEDYVHVQRLSATPPRRR